VGTISKKIKPDMKATLVTPEQTTRTLDAWETLKVIQQEGVDFSLGGKAMQTQFEKSINRVKAVAGEDGTFRQRNLNDYWEIRKDYDAVIPSRVKQADSLSDSRLQFQKETWLDNRALLNDTINDVALGLGDESLTAFSNMTDLYLARQNIIGKTKLAKGTPGIISQKNLFRLGGIWIGGSILQSITGIDIPGI